MRCTNIRTHSTPRLLAVSILACVASPGLVSALDLYTSSDVTDLVHRYNGSTGVLTNVLVPSFAASQQLAIHFGQSQNRVLLGHFNGGVEEFNATTGAYIKTYNPTGGVQWAGLFGPNGNVIVGDWLTNTVKEYDVNTGLYVQTLTTVQSPSDMRIGPNGNLFVCSFSGGYVKEVQASNGAFVSQWNLPSSAQPNDLAFLPNGDILVTAMVTNLVYRFDAAHNLLGSFTGTGWGNPHGIHISPWTGRVLVIDGVTAQVHEFDPTSFAEITPTFLTPAPGKKIVDLDFFAPPPVLATPFCTGDTFGPACPCGNSGVLGHGCANSSFASGALLTASGFAGTLPATDTLVLTATEIPGPGLFFQSNALAPTPIPFGDGNLCAAIGIVRLGVVFPTGAAAAYPGGSTSLPIHIAGSVQAGNVKHYQCWYRSVPGLCGPNPSGLTQGLSITFGL
ncbi:MAG: hypothetical protein SGI72_02440 [Planctomycetota bacterium]|nr:hypothetical protein [Planctomycetota bacterium]